MIDERHEELAALYAFDLLEGAERAQFEVALTADPRLQALVRSFRESASVLAQTAAKIPPPELRQRVLASVSASSPASTAPAPGNVIRPAPSVFRSPRVSWAAAACFALLALWLGQRFLTARKEIAQLQRQNAVADVALQSVRQQLEADRLVTRRQQDDLQQKLTAAQTQLAQARTEVDRTVAQLAAASTQGSQAASALASAETQLANARRELTERDARVASLKQQIDTAASATADLGKQIEQARERVAQLTSEMLRERELANFKISVFASLARENPQALAVAVWDASKKEGVLRVEKLPALATNQDYQLWIVDPQYKDPVDGGTFTVDPQTGEARIKFSVRQPISTVEAFAISRERKGGVPKAEGPVLMFGK